MNENTSIRHLCLPFLYAHTQPVSLSLCLLMPSNPTIFGVRICFSGLSKIDNLMNLLHLQNTHTHTPNRPYLPPSCSFALFYIFHILVIIAHFSANRFDFSIIITNDGGWLAIWQMHAFLMSKTE